MPASGYELKCHLKFPIFMLYPMEGGDVLLTTSHMTMKTFCLLLLFILQFRASGKAPSKFRPSDQFSYTFIANNFELLRKHIFLDMKVNPL